MFKIIFAGVIHMKKTIIAASIAAVVAAPAAFADVSISGYASAEFAEDQMQINNDIVFKASEDLGNGMKATAKYHMFTDTNHTDGSTPDSKTADMSITLSGDFGSLTAGRSEGFDEGVFAAFVNIDAAHDADLEGYFDGAAEVQQRDERLKYVSPSFNGVKIGITTQDNGANKFEDKEYMVSYSANGLMVMAGKSEEGTNETTNIAASYKMGDLEVRVANRELDQNGATTDASFLGAKYTMGANTIALGTVNADAGDANIFSVAHNFSKNTSVYAVVTDPDGADSTTLIGMSQKF
jgi:predicted porin